VLGHGLLGERRLSAPFEPLLLPRRPGPLRQRWWTNESVEPRKPRPCAQDWIKLGWAVAATAVPAPPYCGWILDAPRVAGGGQWHGLMVRPSLLRAAVKGAYRQAGAPVGFTDEV